MEETKRKMDATLQKIERKYNRHIRCLGYDEYDRIQAGHKTIGEVTYFPGWKVVKTDEGRYTLARKDVTEEIALKEDMLKVCAAHAKTVVVEFLYGAYSSMRADDIEYLGAVCDYLNEDTVLYYVKRSMWQCPDFTLQISISFYE